MRIRLFIAAAVLFAAPAAMAQAPAPYTFDAARRSVSLSSPRVSPDGRWVAFIVTKPDFDDNHNDSELWLADAVAGRAHALTFERHAVSSPQWSPDGTTLGFMAPDRLDRPQVWLLPMSPGEARVLTHSPTGVEHFSWRPDGQAIAFAAADTTPMRTGESRHIATFRVGDQDLFLRHELSAQHIWVQPLAGDAKRVTSGPWSLEFALPPGRVVNATTKALIEMAAAGASKLRPRAGGEAWRPRKTPGRNGGLPYRGNPTPAARQTPLDSTAQRWSAFIRKWY